MAERIDITGQTFGNLTVIDFAYSKRGKAFWKCKCSCGNNIIYESYPLRTGQRQSCGCEKYKGLPKGYSQEPLYSLWWNMKRRCGDKTVSSYKNYGAKGIKVCKEWLDYAEFYKWAYSNNYKYGLTLDRIDSNKNYCPENCRWVDWKTQERNRKNNKIITFNGETHCLTEWAEITGINKRTLRNRLLRGWSVEKSLTEHIHSKNERRNRNG